jgi:hypothetical protein
VLGLGLGLGLGFVLVLVLVVVFVFVFVFVVVLLSSNVIRPPSLQEPETNITLRTVSQRRPHAFINAHSGMYALLVPYDSQKQVANDPNVRATEKILAHASHRVCRGADADRYGPVFPKVDCLLGAGGSAVGYLAHGTATDYMHEVAKIPLVATLEMFGTDDPSCFKMFNPASQISLVRGG